MKRYRPYAPEQPYLMPPSLEEWLPSDHLAYFISDTVDQLNLRGFKVQYGGAGKDRTLPYHPSMLVKVTLYAYATGVFASRQIERKLKEDIAFRVLGAGNFPSYRTIARFRKENLSAFSGVFSQIVGIAKEAGLVKLGLVAIDGSKVHANASKHKAMSYGRLGEEEARLEAEIKDLFEKAEAADEADAHEEEMNIPEELLRRETRLEAIKAANGRLEERQSGKKLTEKSQENFTDPDSRIMKTSAGFEQCYNAQVGVDAEAQIIVAAEVTQAANDKQQLIPVTQAVEVETGELPERVTADSGYCSEQCCKNLEDLEVKGYVRPGREGKEPHTIDTEKEATRRMAYRVTGKRGKKIYAKRKAIVEPVFGWVKNVLGFRQFLLRGLDAVQAEWRLVCAALNLRRLSVRLEWKIA